MENHFLICFVPGIFLSLDEYLVHAFIKMKFKFIIITKYAWYGIKIYVVTDAETAYVIKPVAYKGKDTVYSSTTNAE